jgi:hypothetical protein
MVDEQIQDDQKRKAAMHRKLNSEIGVLTSDNLLIKASSMSQDRPNNAQILVKRQDGSPSSTSKKERKTRKQRLTRISE